MGDGGGAVAPPRAAPLFATAQAAGSGPPGLASTLRHRPWWRGATGPPIGPWGRSTTTRRCRSVEARPGRHSPRPGRWRSGAARAGATAPGPPSPTRPPRRRSRSPALARVTPWVWRRRSSATPAFSIWIRRRELSSGSPRSPCPWATTAAPGPGRPRPRRARGSSSPHLDPDPVRQLAHEVPANGIQHRHGRPRVRSRSGRTALGPDPRPPAEMADAFVARFQERGRTSSRPRVSRCAYSVEPGDIAVPPGKLLVHRGHVVEDGLVPRQVLVALSSAS